MSRKQLLITCSGGLGNRLTGLVSGLALAARHDLELSICWPLGLDVATAGTPAGFFCPLEMIIQPPCRVVSVQDRDNWLTEPHEHFSLLRQTQDPFCTGNYDMTYCWTHGPIRNAEVPDQKMHEYFKTLHMTQAVHDRMTEGHLKLGQRRGYVGGLVRCNGHSKTKAWQPVERFTRLLPTINDPFYLCCDDVRVTDRMMQQYKHVVTLPKPVKHNTTDALVIVMAEILLMAQADRFYGSWWSMLCEPVRLLRDDLTCLIPK